MDDWIVGMLNVIGGKTLNTGSLLQLPSEYNKTAYEAMLTFQNVAVKPITAIVLSIMLMLMLQQASTRADGDHMASVRLIGSVMIKAALLVALLQISPQILQGIDQIGISLIKAGNTISVNAPGTKQGPLGDSLRDWVSSLNWGGQAAMLLVTFIPWLLALVVSIIPTVIILWRFIQLDLMTAFSSLPLAFLAHDDTKQIGIGFLKRYGIITLQGVMIIAGVKLYQAFMSTWAAANLTLKGGIKEILEGMAAFYVGPILLLLLIIGSNSLAKAIVGEG